jgi:hypothetical protein
MRHLTIFLMNYKLVFIIWVTPFISDSMSCHTTNNSEISKKTTLFDSNKPEFEINKIENSSNTLDLISPFITNILINDGNLIEKARVSVLINYSEPITLTSRGFMLLTEGYLESLNQENDTTVQAVVVLPKAGIYSMYLNPQTVQDLAGNLSKATIKRTLEFLKPQPKATYYLEAMNTGFYKVSLIPHVNYSGDKAITATGQVTLQVSKGNNPNQTFTVDNLVMLVPGVYWEVNSRYSGPVENPNIEYISFGLQSKGTNEIPYISGDTVPLFMFKNFGICNDDSVRLMPIEKDPFLWPNSSQANVGQQLTVSGYNEPDLPLVVSGVAPCIAEVTFCLSALLQGPFVATEELMHDSLRRKKIIPLNEPYNNFRPLNNDYLPFTHAGDGGAEFVNPGVFVKTGNNAIVDWVMIELRSQADMSKLIATRSAFIQRNGKIVDVDTYGPVKFKKLESSAYYIGIRDRNHLGILSLKPYYLSNSYRRFSILPEEARTFICNNNYDFRDLNNPVYGEEYFSSLVIGNKRLMWAGNSNADKNIMFQGGGIGEGLDKDNVFFNIISDPNNQSASYNHVRDGYYLGDNNMDGFIKY